MRQSQDTVNRFINFPFLYQFVVLTRIGDSLHHTVCLYVTKSGYHSKFIHRLSYPMKQVNPSMQRQTFTLVANAAIVFQLHDSDFFNHNHMFYINRLSINNAIYQEDPS